MCSFCRFSNVQGQFLASCVNISTLFKANSACIFTCYCNLAVFRKFISAILLQYAGQGIFQILISIAGQGAVDSGSNLMIRFMGNIDTANASTFTSIFIEDNISQSHDNAVAGQATSNLGSTNQITLIFCISFISQLTCQGTKSIGNYINICCYTTITISNQVYNGASLGVFNNGIAISTKVTVCIIFIEHIGHAAVLINSKGVSIFLVNIACSCCTCTTLEGLYMAACKRKRF